LSFLTVPYTLYWKDANLVYRGCYQHLAVDPGLASTSAVIGETDADLPWRAEEIKGFRAVDRRVIEINTPEHDRDETTTELYNTLQSGLEARKSLQGRFMPLRATFCGLSQHHR
jgi:hypothetical protein